MQERSIQDLDLPFTLPDDTDVDVLQPRRATPEELERRRVIIDRIVKRREEIGPIGISVEELLDRDEFER